MNRYIKDLIVALLGAVVGSFGTWFLKPTVEHLYDVVKQERAHTLKMKEVSAEKTLPKNLENTENALNEGRDLLRKLTTSIRSFRHRDPLSFSYEKEELEELNTNYQNWISFTIKQGSLLPFAQYEICKNIQEILYIEVMDISLIIPQQADIEKGLELYLFYVENEFSEKDILLAQEEVDSLFQQKLNSQKLVEGKFSTYLDETLIELEEYFLNGMRSYLGRGIDKQLSTRITKLKTHLTLQRNFEFFPNADAAKRFNGFKIGNKNYDKEIYVLKKSMIEKLLLENKSSFKKILKNKNPIDKLLWRNN
ncbi:hypothetical protein [Bdellovibrio sp. HCB274]|uniref:hypothetical protein n=1 Tax=Bdellovibrio sp. HCB274 TaxID=3394361 RepID=UPI0039B46D8A